MRMNVLEADAAEPLLGFGRIKNHQLRILTDKQKHY